MHGHQPGGGILTWSLGAMTSTRRTCLTFCSTLPQLNHTTAGTLTDVELLAAEVLLVERFERVLSLVLIVVLAEREAPLKPKHTDTLQHQSPTFDSIQLQTSSFSGLPNQRRNERDILRDACTYFLSCALT